MARVIEAPLPALTDEQIRAREAAARRMAEFTAARDRMRAERRSQIDEWERGNVEIARDVRRRFDEGV
jgi:hypothetical protein